MTTATPPPGTPAAGADVSADDFVMALRPDRLAPGEVWRGPGLLALVVPVATVELIGGLVVLGVLGPVESILDRAGLGTLFIAAGVQVVAGLVAGGFGLNAAVVALATQAQGLRPSLPGAWAWSAQHPMLWARASSRMLGTVVAVVAVLIGAAMVVDWGTRSIVLGLLAGIAGAALTLWRMLPGWVVHASAVLLDGDRTDPAGHPAGVRAPQGWARLCAAPVVVGSWLLAVVAGVVERYWPTEVPGIAAVVVLLGALCWTASAGALIHDALALVDPVRVPGLPRVPGRAQSGPVGGGSRWWLLVAVVLWCLPTGALLGVSTLVDAGRVVATTPIGAAADVRPAVAVDRGGDD